METRYLGGTGLRVSVLSFGAMTFGGAESPFFAPIGTTAVDEARELVSTCIDAGVNLFDTADVYSNGASESILGGAIGARRADVLVATKLHGTTGEGPNDLGQSRHHIVRACEDSLRRLGTDWIDLLQVHGFDGRTRLEETLRALDDLVSAGKVRYVGCSNYSGWQLMKALAISDRDRLGRYANVQAYYSLGQRELEFELVPLALDQGVGILVWSPLSGGLFSGKFRRGQSEPAESRRAQMGQSPGTIDLERAYDTIEVLAEVAAAHAAEGATIAQAALNWVLAKPGVTSLVVGARTPAQLADNLAASSWSLTPEEVGALDRVSEPVAPYPYWHQRTYNLERMTDPWLDAYR